MSFGSCGKRRVLVKTGGTMEFAVDPEPTVLTLLGREQSKEHSPDLELNRRRLLKGGIASIVATSLPGLLLHAQSAQQSCSPLISQNHAPFNSGPCPYPIPWLDKNGNHNQSPMANVELSNIYHFKGKLARCNGFHGMGTDNKGNRLAWGTPTTDYSYIGGEYWAARHPHRAVFAHT
jgi:hypothetical protein